MPRTNLLLTLSLLACASTAPAKAPPNPNAAADAVAAFGGLMQPIAKMSPGPARAQQACGSVDKLKAGAKAVPTAAPASTAIDAPTWKSHVETLAFLVDEMEKTCKAPGMKRKDSLGNAHTVDGDIKDLNDYVGDLNDSMKPRSLTPEMKTFDQAMRKAWPDRVKHKHLCKETGEMASVLDALEAAPAGVDKAKWADAYKTLHENFPDVKGMCVPGVDDLGAFESAFNSVHDSFYTMVTLLPAAK